MNTQSITIGNRYGYIDMPENYIQIKGVIIMIPCFTCEGTHNGLIRISELLNERGYATLRIDMSGVGRSTGEFSSQTIDSHVEDLVLFTQYVKENISEDIIFVGHDIGGLIGILANEISPVVGIITLSTSFSFDYYDFTGKNIDNFEHPDLFKININDNTTIVRKDYMGIIDENMIHGILDESRTPLISVFFEEDDQISYEKSMEILKSTHSNIETILLSEVTRFMDTDIESYYVGNLIDIWAQNKLNTI